MERFEISPGRAPTDSRSRFINFPRPLGLVGAKIPRPPAKRRAEFHVGRGESVISRRYSLIHSDVFEASLAGRTAGRRI